MLRTIVLKFLKQYSVRITIPRISLVWTQSDKVASLSLISQIHRTDLITSKGLYSEERLDFQSDR